MVEVIRMSKIPQNILHGQYYYKIRVWLSVYRIGGQVPHALVLNFLRILFRTRVYCSCAYSPRQFERNGVPCLDVIVPRSPLTRQVFPIIGFTIYFKWCFRRSYCEMNEAKWNKFHETWLHVFKFIYTIYISQIAFSPHLIINRNISLYRSIR